VQHARRFLPDLLIILSQALVFVPIAWLRYVDDDEGNYVLASALVDEGRVPYRDFLHFQMPLIPYAYGAWIALVGEDFRLVRLLSVACAIATGALVYAILLRAHGRSAAILGLFFYALSSLTFGWLTTVKTQALATLFLVAAFAAATWRPQPSTTLLAVCGACCGLAVDARLTCAAAVPAFLWVAVSERFRGVAAYAGGLAAALSPAVVLAIVAPAQFWFDNFGYHRLRAEGGLVGDFGEKAQVVANLFGIGTTEGAIGSRGFGVQFLILTVLAATGLALLRPLGRRVKLPLLLALLVGGANLMPTPTYTHYQVSIVPFLVLAAVESLAWLRGRPAFRGDHVARRVLAAGLAAAIVVYAAAGAGDAYRYARVVGAEDARIGNIDRVAETIDARTTSGEKVLTSWPGYLFGTHADPVPGLENDFARYAAATLTPADAHRYGLATVADVHESLRTHRTRLVVVKPWHLIGPMPEWDRVSKESGYVLEARIGDVRIYALPNATTASRTAPASSSVNSG